MQTAADDDDDADIPSKSLPVEAQCDSRCRRRAAARVAVRGRRRPIVHRASLATRRIRRDEDDDNDERR
jgi:hypothetical protein